MAPRQTRPVTGYLLVLAATAIWSGNFIVARGLSDSIPPVTLGFLRWATAVLAVLPFGLRPLYRSRSTVRKNLGYLALCGFLGVTVFNTLIYIAAHTSKALNLSLIAICSPLFIVMFARVFLGEPFTRPRIIGLVAATLGVVLLITGGHTSRLTDMHFSAGDAWMLVASAIFALYGILVRVKSPELSPMVFLTSTFILGLVFLVPWVAWEMTAVREIHFSRTAIASIVYLGIGPSLLAFWCWNQAIAIIGPVRSAFVYYCLPLFSGLEALVLLNEPIQAVHVVSGVLILTGVVVATRE
ncbi:MAG TPA: DMT family transporter [Desulfomonilaceae bacterium]|nr:DMT family transporter [Desulfomonilaceae bacterium]